MGWRQDPLRQGASAGSPPTAPTIRRNWGGGRGEANISSFGNCPQTPRTGFITDRFPHFCPHFQLRTQGQSLHHRTGRKHSPPSHRMLPGGQHQPQPPAWATGHLGAFAPEAFLLSCLPWSLCQRQMMVADSVAGDCEEVTSPVPGRWPALSPTGQREATFLPDRPLRLQCDCSISRNTNSAAPGFRG